jgi:hypothetical protein
MDLSEEIRVWGARKTDNSYWGYNVYKQFAEELEYSSIEMAGETATLISKTETDEDYEGDIQLVFKWDSRVFAMDGTYSSWNGTEWSGTPYEVEAQPVTRIEYVRKR